MPTQVRFFHNDATRDRLLAKAAELGLSAYGLPPDDSVRPAGPSMVALGFSEPRVPSAWVDGDYIEYSYVVASFTARLWFDPHYPNGSMKPGSLSDAYRCLAKFAKASAVYERDLGIWVPREFERECRVHSVARERELQLLVETNRKVLEGILLSTRRPEDEETSGE